MLKILNQIVNSTIKFLLAVLNIAKKIFAKTILKLMLLPLYRLFLFNKKILKKYFLNEGGSDIGGEKRVIKYNYSLHFIILILTVIIAVNNIASHETYAEEFGQGSIMSEVLKNEDDVVVMIRAAIINTADKNIKIETIKDELGAVEIKNYAEADNNTEQEDQWILAHGGEALINPFSHFFEEEMGANVPSRRKEIETYTVEAGDTLSAIASRFGISVNTLLWANSLSINSYIRPGDKLVILPANGIIYTVKAGDNISSIAQKYSVTADKILSFNNLAENGSIQIKQKLIIPDAKQIYAAPAMREIKPLTQIFSQTPAGSGGYIWPSISKRITQYYNWRHSAIDIGAKTGTPIYATKGGRIERSGWSTGYGYNVVINHGDGTKSLYAHASKLLTNRGDQVDAGQIIAEIGSTGWSTGPHLHFELIINGKRVNPLSYL